MTEPPMFMPSMPYAAWLESPCGPFNDFPIQDVSLCFPGQETFLEAGLNGGHFGAGGGTKGLNCPLAGFPVDQQPSVPGASTGYPSKMGVHVGDNSLANDSGFLDEMIDLSALVAMETNGMAGVAGGSFAQEIPGVGYNGFLDTNYSSNSWFSSDNNQQKPLVLANVCTNPASTDHVYSNDDVYCDLQSTCAVSSSIDVFNSCTPVYSNNICDTVYSYSSGQFVAPLGQIATYNVASGGHFNNGPVNVSDSTFYELTNVPTVQNAAVHDNNFPTAVSVLYKNAPNEEQGIAVLRATADATGTGQSVGIVDEQKALWEDCVQSERGKAHVSRTTLEPPLTEVGSLDNIQTIISHDHGAYCDKSTKEDWSILSEFMDTVPAVHGLDQVDPELLSGLDPFCDSPTAALLPDYGSSNVVDHQSPSTSQWPVDDDHREMGNWLDAKFDVNDFLQCPKDLSMNRTVKTEQGKKFGVQAGKIAKKTPMPALVKDQRYFALRAQNNESCKKSRQSRKNKMELIRLERVELEERNQKLQLCVGRMEQLAKDLKQKLLERMAG